MLRNIFTVISISLLLLFSGCAPLILGAGAAGGYLASADSVEASFDVTRDEAYKISRKIILDKGEILEEDEQAGFINGYVVNTNVKIYIEETTPSTTKVRVSGRRFLTPDISTAQNILMTISKQLL